MPGDVDNVGSHPSSVLAATDRGGRRLSADRFLRLMRKVQKCKETFGRIDILVNNVGGLAKGAGELSEANWDR